MAELAQSSSSRNGAIWLAVAVIPNLVTYFISKSLTKTDSSGKTKLHRALRKPGCSQLSRLLSRGADVNAQDNQGNSPLHLAADKGKVDAMKLLLANTVPAKTDLVNQDLQTALHRAAHSGCIDACQLLLENGADPNAQDKNGYTPLSIAAHRGNMQIVEQLLSRGAKVELAEKRNAHTPLHIASRRGHDEVVGVLLAHGANASSLDHHYFKTPLHLAADHGSVKSVELLLNSTSNRIINMEDKLGRTPLFYSLFRVDEAGQAEVTKLLLARGANMEARNGFGQTLLYQLAADRNLAGVNLLLTSGEPKAEVNARDRDDMPPLYVAAKKGYGEVVQLLLSNGADMNMRNQIGETLLHRAANEGSENAVRLLIEAGADLKALDNEYQTPLYVAAKSNKKNCTQLLANADRWQLVEKCPGCSWTLLHRAASKGEADAADLLADQMKEQRLLNGLYELDNDGRPPLYLAAEFNKPDVVTRLRVKHHVDPEMKNNDGRTLLHRAANEGKARAAELLITRAESDKNAQDNNGKSALHIASTIGSEKFESVVNTLLDYEADIDLKDKMGLTPLHGVVGPSETPSSIEMTRLLISRAANTMAKDNDGQTPLHTAVLAKNLEIVKLLSESQDFDINVTNSNGQTALHALISENESEASIEMAKLLLARGAYPATVDHAGQTPLHTAAISNRLNTVGVLLDSSVVLETANRLNSNKETALQAVIANGENDDSVKMVRLLVKKGAVDTTTRDQNGKTPLHIATSKGYPRIAAELLDHPNANDTMNTTDNNGQTPLLAVIAHGEDDGSVGMAKLLANNGAANILSRDEHGRTPLHVAISMRYYRIAEELLNGPLPIPQEIMNATDESGRTAVHALVGTGGQNPILRVHLIEALISNGANAAMSKDHMGETPLHTAATSGDVDVVLALLKDPLLQYSINTTDRNGQTVLHKAARRGDLQVFQALLSSGADPSQTDNDLRTAMHPAAECGKSEIVGIMRNHPDWDLMISMKDKSGMKPYDLALQSEDQATIGLLAQCLPPPNQEPNPFPTTPEEYIEYFQQTMGGFNPPGGWDDERVKYIAQQALELAPEMTARMNLAPEYAPKLAKLWLYEYVVLCDDSGSMLRHPERIEALTFTLQRAADIATKIDHGGISVRFLNYNKDTEGNCFDNMKDSTRIMKDVERVYQGHPGGPTKLGTTLEAKVVKDALKKIERKKLEWPLMVFIITDGIPNNEDHDQFQKTILSCEKRLRKLGKSSSSILFIIAQVGRDSKGDGFIKGLQAVDQLREMLYVSKDKLEDVVRKVTDQSSVDLATSQLVKLFVKACDSQSAMNPQLQIAGASTQ